MKKNKFLKLASGLLMLVLITCCAVSGTFAKYVTTGSATDTARVAKWGIELAVTGDNVLYDDAKSGDEVTAVKVLTNNLAAPGTYQKLATVALTGTPEVAYQIKVEVDLDLGDKWIVGGAVYCPLVFTVDGTEFKIDATNTTTALLEEAIEKAIMEAISGEEDGVAEYNAGVAVPATAASVLIDWLWAFEGNDDTKDTILGNAFNATIDFSLTVTVTQVD